MPFSINEHYHATVVAIQGKFLGSVEREAFKDAIDALKEAGKINVVIDLSATEFMDSTGIGLLIGALTTMRRAGGDVRLAGMQERIENLFLMTRLLGSAFEDYDTVDAAVASFEASPADEG